MFINGSYTPDNELGAIMPTLPTWAQRAPTNIGPYIPLYEPPPTNTYMQPFAQAPAPSKLTSVLDTINLGLTSIFGNKNNVPATSGVPLQQEPQANPNPKGPGAGLGGGLDKFIEGATQFVKDYPLIVAGAVALVFLKQSKPYSRR